MAHFPDSEHVCKTIPTFRNRAWWLRTFFYVNEGASLCISLIEAGSF